MEAAVPLDAEQDAAGAKGPVDGIDEGFEFEVRVTHLDAECLATVVGLQGAVHDDDVSFVHVGIHHGDTVNLGEEGGGAVAHQELHQV